MEVTPLVFKFGGASVKDAAAVKNVASIVQQNSHRPMVVVVSAMGKSTNAMEGVVQSWANGNAAEAVEGLRALVAFHRDVCVELFGPECDEITAQLATWEEEIAALLQRPTTTSYAQQYDAVVHHGELMSTYIIAQYLGQFTPTVWQDTRNLVKTNSDHRRATVNWEATEKAIRAAITPEHVHVVQGFIGSSEEGTPTTLGREGSDYTGAVFAYCLGADSLTIWKDVPGMLNGDPKTFENTAQIMELPYREAIELAYYGASIIHPKTVQPLQRAGIPLHIKSFLNSALPGTTINNAPAATPHLPHFILKKNQVLISVATTDLAFIAEKHLSQVYQWLAEFGVESNVVQNGAVKANLCVNNDRIAVPKLIEALKGVFNVSVEENMLLYTVRNYTESHVGELAGNKPLYLEQRTPGTVQFVVKA